MLNFFLWPLWESWTWRDPNMAPLHYPQHQQPTPLPPASWYVVCGVCGSHIALAIHAMTLLDHGTSNLILSDILALVLAVIVNVFEWNLQKRDFLCLCH